MLIEFLSSPYIIAFLFFLIAFIYSSVGLGGGSSYTALMTILGFSTLVIPMVSLMLNLLVTLIGSINYIRHKHARWNLILPFLVTSIPMAYLGGSLQLDKQTFYWILLISLCFVAARIYFWTDTSLKLQLTQRTKLLVALSSGAILGLVAGVVGIGGGIYLVPLIIVLGLGTPKEAAASGVIFIFINSLAGLIARLHYNMIDFSQYLPMIIAVVLGGILGSHMGAARYSPRIMEKLLGMVILVAIILLGRKLIL